jgi:hypothetical protein
MVGIDKFNEYCVFTNFVDISSWPILFVLQYFALTRPGVYNSKLNRYTLHIYQLKYIIYLLSDKVLLIAAQLAHYNRGKKSYFSN